jgi:hypothetical protein
MRAIFSVVGLLLVVAIIGLLAKKQLTGGPAPAPASGSTGTAGVVAPAGTPKQQVQQFQRAVQDTMQQPRPMPEEK